MILAILACKLREASSIMSVFNLIKLCSSLPRVEQKLSICGEREREMCVRLRSRCGEREMCVPVLNRNGADRERERGVCACWESKTSRGSTGDTRRLRFGRSF